MGHKSMVASIMRLCCPMTGAVDRRYCEGYQGLIADRQVRATSCALTRGGWHVTWAVTAAALCDSRPLRTRTIGRSGDERGSRLPVAGPPVTACAKSGRWRSQTSRHAPATDNCFANGRRSADKDSR
jgi:hypothetical protein